MVGLAYLDLKIRPITDGMHKTGLSTRASLFMCMIEHKEEKKQWSHTRQMFWTIETGTGTF